MDKPSEAAIRAAAEIETASVAIGNKVISKRGMEAIINATMEPKRQQYETLKDACIKTEHEIQQIAGKALGYPRYADDQKNFPGATGDDVFVGEHVATTITAELAQRYTSLKEAARQMAKALEDLLYLECGKSFGKDSVHDHFRECYSALESYRKATEGR